MATGSSKPTQRTLTFRLQGIPADTPPDARFTVLGDWTGWCSQSGEGVMEPGNQGMPSVRFKLHRGLSQVRSRLTRGHWHHEETCVHGVPVERVLTLDQDEVVVDVNVDAWRDQISPDHKVTGQMVLDVSEIHGLDPRRVIRILLPPNYDQSEDRYPVLYMQDGQNLFDERTAFASEWGLDECLDELYRQHDFPPVIVVGIDNGEEQRLDEYSPWFFQSSDHTSRGLGAQYAYFVAQKLKPYIDRRFRTLAGRQHTALAGSSMGGLIALFTGLEYNGVFSKVAALSPSVDTQFHGERLRAYLKQVPMVHPGRFYLDIGNREADKDGVEEVGRLAGILNQRGVGKVRFREIPDGEHSETSWGSRFGQILQWLCCDWKIHGSESM